jgi:uncharacterized metal-binding protein
MHTNLDTDISRVHMHINPDRSLRDTKLSSVRPFCRCMRFLKKNIDFCQELTHLHAHGRDIVDEDGVVVLGQ